MPRDSLIVSTTMGIFSSRKIRIRIWNLSWNCWKMREMGIWIFRKVSPKLLKLLKTRRNMVIKSGVWPISVQGWRRNLKICWKRSICLKKYFSSCMMRMWPRDKIWGKYNKNWLSIRRNRKQRVRNQMRPW